MNCANHPERTATAFCQNCGKPLCPECIRGADGLLLCEPCLLSRASAAGAGGFAAGASAAAAFAPGSPASGPAWSTASSTPPVAAGAWQPVTQPGMRPGAPAGYAPVGGNAQTSPGLAALLGFIPGVGAMYNGQFVKALLHVIIFIVLIGTTEHLPLVGILIGAWVFYQVFDAAQTASARRDGRPLPDPFGILDMSQRLGPQQPIDPPTPFAGPPAGSYQAAPPPFAASQPGQAASRPQPSGPAYAPMQAVPYTPPQRRGEPVGAIVLIAVGLLFLLSTLGVLDVDWIWRGWPVLVLLLGVWLLFRRATAVPSLAVPSPAPAAPVAAAPVGAPEPEAAPFRRDQPLSITPQPAGSHEGPQGDSREEEAR